MDTGTESIICSLKEALEKRIAYGLEDENVTIVLSSDAVKSMLEELKNLLNTEDDEK